MDISEDVDSLAHFGVLGMKWGQRKQEVSNSSDISDSQKSGLKKAALIVGGGTALAATIFIAVKLRKPPRIQNLNQKSIESGEKLVKTLLVKASKRPAFAVDSNGVARKTYADPAANLRQLEKEIGKLDYRKSINFLRNESNVPLRESIARDNGEWLARISNDPTVSLTEAAKRHGARNEIIYNSIREHVQ